MIIFGDSVEDRRRNAIRQAVANAAYFGVNYRVFSDTSGNVRVERASGMRPIDGETIVKPGDTVETFLPVNYRIQVNVEEMGKKPRTVVRSGKTIDAFEREYRKRYPDARLSFYLLPKDGRNLPAPTTNASRARGKGRAAK